MSAAAVSAHALQPSQPSVPSIFARAVRAELRAAMRTGGLRTWCIVALGLALLGGAGVAALAHWLETSSADLSVAGSGWSTLVLAIGLAASVTRSVSDGTVVVGRLALPRRRTLMAAQVASSMLIVMAVALATALPFVLLGPLVPGVSLSPWWETCAVVFINVVAAGLVAAFMHLVSLALRNGALVATTALAVFLIVPVAAQLGALFVPQGLAGPLALLGDLMVGSGLQHATMLPGGADDWSAFLGGWASLLAWVVVAWVLADRVSRRAGYGEG